MEIEEIKEKILNILQEHGDMTLEDLQKEIGINEDNKNKEMFLEALEELRSEDKIDILEFEDGTKSVFLINPNIFKDPSIMAVDKLAGYLQKVLGLSMEIPSEFAWLADHFTVGTRNGEICINFNNQPILWFRDIWKAIKNSDDRIDPREKIIEIISKAIKKAALAFLGKEYSEELIRKFAEHLYKQILIISKSENVSVLNQIEEIMNEILKLILRGDALIDTSTKTIWIKAHEAKEIMEKYELLKYAFITKYDRVSYNQFPDRIKKWIEDPNNRFGSLNEEKKNLIKRNKYTWYIFSIEKLKSAMYTAGKGKRSKTYSKRKISKAKQDIEDYEYDI